MSVILENMERKTSLIIVAVFVTLALCLALGVGVSNLYRAYKVADIVSDETTEDDLNLAKENAESYYEAHLNALMADKRLDTSAFLSTELNRLWDSAFEGVYEIPDNFPDWDMFLLAQDWDDPSFEIVSVTGNSKEAEVSVKVRNFGIEKINVLQMVREGDRYLIDNFVTEGYDLRDLLAKQLNEKYHDK